MQTPPIRTRRSLGFRPCTFSKENGLPISGSGYQSSIDSVIAALWMALFGKSTTSLMASSLACHIVLALLGSTLRRSVGVWCALVLALLWVFTTACVHGYALYPPRQASLTLVFVSWWLVSRKRLSTGALVAGLAAFADPLALVFPPSTALDSTLSSAESTWRQRWHVLGALTIGLVAFMWLRMRPDVKGARSVSSLRWIASFTTDASSWTALFRGRQAPRSSPRKP